MKQGFTIFLDSELLIPVFNLEAEWKATDVTWLEEEIIQIAKKSRVKVNKKKVEKEKVKKLHSLQMLMKINHCSKIYFTVGFCTI